MIALNTATFIVAIVNIAVCPLDRVYVCALRTKMTYLSVPLPVPAIVLLIQRFEEKDHQPKLSSPN